MDSRFIKYIWIVPFLVFLQIFVLNQILFASYINPFLYILPIITFPKNTPKWFLLIFSFVIGALIDLFSGTIGYHSTACVAMAFAKPSICKFTIPNNTVNDQDDLAMRRVGIRNFLIYTLILAFIHHGILFIIEHIDLYSFFRLVLKIILSSLITVTLIFVTEILFYKNE